MPATVLCVDDDRDLCRILERSFSGEGYRVEHAYDGEKALTMLTEVEPDLVILDALLPRRDGFEVLEELRARPAPLGEIPVLMLTGGQVSPEYRERSRSLGAAAIMAKPVPLEVLLGLVKQHLKAPPPIVDAASAPPPLQGTLDEVAFPSLLHHLHGMRATGVLLVSTSKKRKAVQMRDGYPVAVRSNLINECLGNLLVRRRVIEENDFQESLRRMRAGEGLQGQILVAMEVITEEEIADALREQVEEKLIEIFRWRRGQFRFENKGRLKGSRTMSLEVSPANLILRGVHAGHPIERVNDYLRANARHFVVRGESPFYRFQEIELSNEERESFENLDGSRQLGEYLTESELTRRTLYGLLVTELLDLRGDPAPAAEPVAKREEEISLDELADDRSLRVELASTAERLRRQNYFEMLGVPRDAEIDAVEEAFEQLARKAHPDHYSGGSHAVRQLADEVFGRISKARDVLTDPQRREHYEHELRRGDKRAVEREEDRRSLEAEIEFQRGEARLRQREYEDALLYFGNALQKAPEEGEYHAHYGWCLHLCHPDDPNIIQESVEHVKRGLKLARDHEKPYLFLGRLYKVMGRGAAAEKMFTRAVEVRPDSVEAMRELRLINMRRQKRAGFVKRILRRTS